MLSYQEEESEDDDHLTPTEILVTEGAVDFIVSVMKKHDDKPAILCAALDAVYNCVDASSALDVSKSGVVEVAFTAFSRFDYDHTLTAAVLQALVAVTDFGVALDEVCGQSGERLVLLMQVMESNLGDVNLLVFFLRLLLNLFAAKENRDLLADGGGINSIFAVMAMHSENVKIVSLCITILARLSANDDLSVV
jgi:hypothetical protein